MGVVLVPFEHRDAELGAGERGDSLEQYVIHDAQRKWSHAAFPVKGNAASGYFSE